MVDESMKHALRHWTIVQPIVSSYVHSLVRDYSTRDDLMQDIAIAVLESFDRYDPAQPFAAWAIGIARNHLRLHFRTVHRSRLRFSDSFMDQLSESFSQVSSRELHHLSIYKPVLINSMVGPSSCAKPAIPRTRNRVKFRGGSVVLPTG